MISKLIVLFVIAAVGGWLGVAGLADEAAKMLFQVISILLILSILLFVFGRSRSI